MLRAALTIFLGFSVLAGPVNSVAFAQEETGTITPEVQAVIDTPQQGADTMPTPEGVPAPVDQASEPKPPEYEDTPQVELRILDKVRAESRTYILNVGRTVAYANIRIRPRACRKSSPLDEPESASFLQIWEVKPDGTSAWIFSGWMFASSPSISSMDHPVYDVTVLDCKAPPPPEEPKKSESQSDSAVTTDEEAPAAEAPAADEAVSDESTNATPETDNAPASVE